MRRVTTKVPSSAAGLVASFMLLTAASAHAAPTTPAGQGLSVSSDGKTFSRDAGPALFRDLGRVVPGSKGNDAVWLRNDADLPIRVRLQLSDGWSESTPLSEATTLTISGLGQPVKTNVGAAIGATCTVISNDAVLKPGEVLKASAAVAISTELTDRDGTLASLGFQIRASAVDASVPVAPQQCLSPSPWVPPTSPELPGTSSNPVAKPSEPSLPQTGFTSGAWAILGASLAILGAILVRRRSTPREH